MTDREKILACIREALSVKAPTDAHSETGQAPAHASPAAPCGPREWLPPVGDSVEERLALFQKNLANLKADFHLDGTVAELTAKLAAVSAGGGWKKIGAHKGELVDAFVRTLGLPVCWTDESYEAQELERCDAAITQCDALVAQTGSVLVSNRSAGGRALSVLPPHHVVLARRDQLVSDLPEAFALLKRKYGAAYPSFISFITGPSRTGDIERILVLGAHGPKKLTIFMW